MKCTRELYNSDFEAHIFIVNGSDLESKSLKEKGTFVMGCQFKETLDMD